MKRYSGIRRRRVLEARRVDGLGRVRRGRVSRYPGIENIVNDDLSDLDRQIGEFNIDEINPGQYDIYGSVYRYVDFTYKGVQFHAVSSGYASIGLEEGGEEVVAYVSFDGLKYSEYIELTYDEGIVLDDEEEEALLEQVVKRTNIVEDSDILDALSSDPYIKDWLIDAHTNYTNESRRRVIESRGRLGRVRRKSGMSRRLVNRAARGRSVTEGRLSSRRRLRASGVIQGRLRRRSVLEGRSRVSAKKTSLAERIFRVTRGENLWKLNS